MKFPRRKFLYLAASAATLPAVSRIAGAQALAPSMDVGAHARGVAGTHVASVRYRGNTPAMRDLVAGRSDWLPIIKSAEIKEK
jgi:hypothetical protein